MSLTNEFRIFFKKADTLARLIAINAGVFILLNLTSLIAWLFKKKELVYPVLMNYVALPANTTQLLTHPWTLLTYMFVHEDLFHIFFNMLWLYWFGRIFTEFQGTKKLLGTYLLGGGGGALLFILSFNIFPVFDGYSSFTYAIGASASILAIVIATATLVPNYSIHLLFIGPIKLKYIAAFAILMDLLSIAKSNSGGHIAHLGGAIYGFVSIQMQRKGRDISGGFATWLDRVFSFIHKRNKLKVAYRRNQRNQFTDEEFAVYKKNKQQRVDEILDKISRAGYDSLSREEKEFLHKVSKE